MFWIISLYTTLLYYLVQRNGFLLKLQNINGYFYFYFRMKVLHYNCQWYHLRGMSKLDSYISFSSSIVQNSDIYKEKRAVFT